MKRKCMKERKGNWKTKHRSKTGVNKIERERKREEKDKKCLRSEKEKREDHKKKGRNNVEGGEKERIKFNSVVKKK